MEYRLRICDDKDWVEKRCEDRWTVLVSVSCVGHNEFEDSLVVLHGVMTTRLSTIAGALMCGDH